MPGVILAGVAALVLMALVLAVASALARPRAAGPLDPNVTRYVRKPQLRERRVLPMGDEDARKAVDPT